MNDPQLQIIIELLTKIVEGQKEIAKVLDDIHSRQPHTGSPSTYPKEGTYRRTSYRF